MWSPRTRQSVRSRPREVLWAISGLVVTGAIVTALAATVYATRNPTATATSQLLLRPAVPLRLLQPMEGVDVDVQAVPTELIIDATTEAAVLASPVVAKQVARALGLPESPEDLSRSVTATAVTDSLVEVQVTASDPRLAAQLANGFAEQYLTYRRSSAARILDRVARNLDARATELRAQIGRSDTTPDQRERELSLLRAIDTRAALLEAFRSLYTAGGDVVKRALLPADRPRPAATAVAGMALGAILGGSLGLLRRLVRQRRTARGELERITGMRVLATVPMDATGVRRGWRRVEPVALHLPGSPTANAYRMLYALLAAQGVGRTLRRLLVVSLLPGQGRSTVAGNLAAMCANAGLTTLLVAADAHDSALLRRLGLPDRGRSASSEAEIPWIARLTATGTSNLLALALDGNGGSADAHAQPRLAQLLDEAAGLAEVVLVDAPPMAAGPQAVMMAAAGFDAVLVVIPAGELDLDGLTDAGWMLEQAGVPLRGMVLAGASDTPAPRR
jgi:Mrp family chromosome partitioning ATPase